MNGSMGLLVVGVVMAASASATVGCLIGGRIGREMDGGLLGFFLGPVGWLIALGLEDTREHCAECWAVVEAEAKRCKWCGRMLGKSTEGKFTEGPGGRPYEGNEEETAKALAGGQAENTEI